MAGGKLFPERFSDGGCFPVACPGTRRIRNSGVRRSAVAGSNFRRPSVRASRFYTPRVFKRTWRCSYWLWCEKKLNFLLILKSFVINIDVLLGAVLQSLGQKFKRELKIFK
ncbi:unnamed protein product [Callosobruchus maculatus]|uniref:Uncharacterized protein n=1 Tax=Callosobruchus maculatus TaxID=64391 RepID=A0A653CJI8_CALMS|nr:unnamed protein product [Callosobruchus maculatus]